MSAGLVRLRIDLAYDGAPFWGFASQPDKTTVQGVLEDALSRFLGGQPVTVTCAGRTDRGVHADAQVVHLDVPADWKHLADLSKVRKALDGMVGTAITISRVNRVASNFSARFDATQRRYRYRLWERPVMPPLLHHDTFFVGVPLDVEAMQAAALPLIGTNDYTSFCRKKMAIDHRTGQEVEATLVRRIDRLTVARSRPAGLILVRVEGKAFCHNMVRAIVGSLLEVGKHRQPVEWMGELLDRRDRTGAGPVAGARGLSLVGVSYT